MNNAITAHTTTRVPTPWQVEVTVPVPSPDAQKTWWKQVTKIDRSERGAWALDGYWLTSGETYLAPTGARLVGCERTRDGRWLVTFARVDHEGLFVIKTWERKSPLGAAVLNYIGRRLDKLAVVPARLADLDWRPSQRDGYCHNCRQDITAADAEWGRFAGRTMLRHAGGVCPPRRNAWPGRCAHCRGPLEAGEGVLDLDPRDLFSGRLVPVHEDVCPPPPPLVDMPQVRDTPNRWANWCRRCGELVPAGEGLYDRGVWHAEGGCPQTCPYGNLPTWRVRSRRRYVVGETMRVLVCPRPGRGERPVPASAPGYQVVDGDGTVEVIVVVVEAVDGGPRGDGRPPVHQGRVRLATWPEASAILAEDLARLEAARPRDGRFVAPLSGEIIGTRVPRRSGAAMALGLVGGSGRSMRAAPRPWVAEIVGRSRRYGLQREFLAARWDYSQANSRGTRGIRLWWTLRPNRFYEIYRPHSWHSSERGFVRVTDEGDVEQVAEADVLVWLRSAAAWIGADVASAPGPDGDL